MNDTSFDPGANSSTFRRRLASGDWALTLPSSRFISHSKSVCRTIDLDRCLFDIVLVKDLAHVTKSCDSLPLSTGLRNAYLCFLATACFSTARAALADMTTCFPRYIPLASAKWRLCATPDTCDTTGDATRWCALRLAALLWVCFIRTVIQGQVYSIICRNTSIRTVIKTCGYPRPTRELFRSAYRTTVDVSHRDHARLVQLGAAPYRTPCELRTRTRDTSWRSDP